MSFASQVYNITLNATLIAVTPALPAGTVGTRDVFGSPDFIPDRCFIVGNVTAADGFATSGERNDFNGFLADGNEYHDNFGFPITRIKSLEEILDFYKNSSTDIGRIRIVTHGWFAFMQFPMFKNGNFNIGIASPRLQAFQDSDEQGLRWLLTQSQTRSPMLYDTTSDIIDGMRSFNSALLAPLKIETPGATVSGDVEQFMDILADHYTMEYGMLGLNSGSPGLTLLNGTQELRVQATIDYCETQIRSRLVGTVLGTAPHTVTVTDTHLDDLKTGVLAATPGQLEFLGAKETLPADIFAPATTAGSLAAAMAASPKVENDLRTAISGGASNLMFSNRTGEILFALATFHSSTLNLSNTITITDWASITSVASLEDYFFICNDLYMLKNGLFEVGGVDINPTQRGTIRSGLLAIADLIKAKISGISSSKLNTLRSTIENLSPQESNAINASPITTITDTAIEELHHAVVGLNAGFRANLNKLRTLMKPSSFVDIRGCKVGALPSYLTHVRDFLGSGINKPTVSAPEWWQSFPDGYTVLPTNNHQGRIFPEIDDLVTNGIPSSNISDADVTTSFDLWKDFLNFDDHYTFITALFADTDADRFNFALLEWRTWQVGGAGAGIPVLNMQAKRVDDLVSLNIGDILERFRIIFEIDTADGLSSAQRTTINALQPFIVSYKTLKASIDAATTPSATPTPAEIDQFYIDLGQIGSGIDAISGTSAPGTLQPALPKDKAKLATYNSNVENYIFTNLTALLGSFFTEIRGQLAHANAEIRYYGNIGLILPIQSSSHPTVTSPTFAASYTGATDYAETYMYAVRGWMKVQWQGTSAQVQALNTYIDGIPRPALGSIGDLTRRSILSDGAPGANPAGLDSHYCPTDDFGALIAKRP